MSPAVAPARAAAAGLLFVAAASVVAYRGDAAAWWYLTPWRVLEVVVVGFGARLWHRRPGTRTGPLVIVWGASLAIPDLTHATTTWVYAPAYVLSFVAAGVAVQIALGLPDGRLRTRPALVLVVLSYAASVGSQVIRYAVDRPLPPPHSNAAHRSDFWADASSLALIVLATAVAIVLTHRLVTASRERRRTLAVPWVAAILWALVCMSIATGALARLGARGSGLVTLTAVLAWSVVVASVFFGHRITVLSAQVRSIAAEERSRMERDLHDGAQQRLYATAILLDLAGRQARDAAAAEAIAQARSNLTVAISSLRTIARPPLDDGLAAAVGRLAEGSPIPITVSVAEGRWPGEAERAAYFVAAEALANVYRHAAAREVHVRIDAGATHLSVVVADDGRGFEPGSGSDLRGLRERVGQAGGHLAVESAPGAGTTITAEIPMEAP